MTMDIKRTHWIILGIVAFLCLTAWLKFSYPKYSLIDLSISRNDALRIATDHLKRERGVDPASFRTASVFIIDDQADRYLQKAMGFRKEKDFLKQHDFELFFWQVRFFKENKKEEYRLTVSSATGQVTGFVHTIEETEARADPGHEKARQLAVDFLSRQFNIDIGQYTVSGDSQRHMEKREEHSFSWEKTGVMVPWDNERADPSAAGGAKILMGATIAGNEVLVFSKNNLSIPDSYNRYLASLGTTGSNLTLVFKFFNYIIFAAAVYFVVIRRHHLVMHTTKNFYIGIAAVLFILTVIDNFNDLQVILFEYNTTSSLRSYLWRYHVETLLHTFFAIIGFPICCLAGEALRFESFREKKESSLLFYLTTGFLNRRVSGKIFLGYVVTLILIGLQAVITEIGRRYWGVWMEHSWKTHFTSAYLPFISALVVGAYASLFEETTFRMFAISWGKKLFNNTALAVFAASVIWGFGHSSYIVYPMWFRGLEVSLIGLFLSFIYLRFGLLSTLVAHYAFNVFLSSSGYFLGKSHPFYFYSSITVLLLPFIWGAAGYLFNKTAEEKPLRWHLNKHQLFHRQVLRHYLNEEKAKGRDMDTIKKELLSHGWDMAVVETAMEESSNGEGSQK